MNKLLFEQLSALADDPAPAASRLSNMLACLYWSDPQISWAGLYRIRPAQACDFQSSASDSAELVSVLDCFQGKPACMVIAPHKGVIGAALDRQSSICVDDVRSFPGHIACDPNSRSELVIPLFHKGVLLAVLDLDSDIPSHFQDVSDPEIQTLGTLFARILAERLEEESLPLIHSDRQGS